MNYGRGRPPDAGREEIPILRVVRLSRVALPPMSFACDNSRPGFGCVIEVRMLPGEGRRTGLFGVVL